MFYLNLTPDFNPYNVPKSDCIDFESFTFKGGEPHIKLKTTVSRAYGQVQEVMITHRVNSFNDLGLLLVAKDAIDRMGVFQHIHLILPYFPGARQDRQMIPGEPLTASVYANVLNERDFSSVTILDPHSDVTPALINRVEVIDNTELVLESIKHMWADELFPINIISPDAGANKKVGKLIENLFKRNTLLKDHIGLVKCDKTRDVSNGALTGFEVYAQDLGNEACLIVDDICDGGGTFLGLATALANKHAGNLYLIVTHGIFSQGFKKLEGIFERIYTSDSIKSKHFYNSTESSEQGVTPKKLTILPIQL